MKVNIGPYVSYYGPYHLAETICFWARRKDEFDLNEYPDWVHSFGRFLAVGTFKDRPRPKVGELVSQYPDPSNTWLCDFLIWLSNKKKRRVHVKIDDWDSVNADYTLALVILPVIKNIKKYKNGGPQVDDEDVPEHIRSINDPDWSGEDFTQDKYYFDRWDWALDEMIFAFETILDENRETKFFSGQMDLDWEAQENGLYQLVDGPNHTSKYDAEAAKKESDRVQNGLILFGKYYQALWT